MKTLNELEDELYLSDKFDDIENIKPEDYNEILNGVNEILSNDQSNIDALSFKSYVLYCQKKFEESIEICNLVLRKCPDDINTLSNKESALFQLSKYKECIDVCQQILRIDPKNKDAIVSWDLAYTCADDPALPKPPHHLIKNIAEWIKFIFIILTSPLLLPSLAALGIFCAIIYFLF